MQVNTLKCTLKKDRLEYFNGQNKTSFISLLCKGCIFYKDQAEFENTKGVIRVRKPKKNRQHNNQKNKNKRTNNDLQNIHIKLKIE